MPDVFYRVLNKDDDDDDDSFSRANIKLALVVITSVCSMPDFCPDYRGNIVIMIVLSND